MRLRLLALVTLAVTLAGCVSQNNSNNPPVSTPTATPTVLSVQLTGSCNDIGGYRLSSTGFTPNGQYRTEAWYPDGKPYLYLLDRGLGKADSSGATPNWKWDCRNGPNGKPDPNGTYHIQMTDLTTGRMAKFTLEVKL